MEIRIVANDLRPARIEIGTLARIDRIAVGLETPARRFMMDQPGPRRQHMHKTALRQPQAQVDVIELDRKIDVVKSTNCLKLLPFDGDARRGHGADLALAG